MIGSEKQVKWANDIKEMLKIHYETYKKTLENEHTKEYVSRFFNLNEIERAYSTIMEEENAKNLINVYSWLKMYMIEDYKKKCATATGYFLSQLAYQGADLILKYIKEGF